MGTFPKEGPAGPQGAQGPAGAPGAGVVPGGAVGQLLAKATAADYDTHWTDPATGGGGSSGLTIGATSVAGSQAGGTLYADASGILQDNGLTFTNGWNNFYQANTKLGLYNSSAYSSWQVYDLPGGGGSLYGLNVYLSSGGIARDNPAYGGWGFSLDIRASSDAFYIIRVNVDGTVTHPLVVRSDGRTVVSDLPYDASRFGAMMTVIVSDANTPGVLILRQTYDPAQPYLKCQDQFGQAAFEVDGQGNVLFVGTLAVRNVTYTFPAAQGAGSLTNDGAGNLTWAASGGGGASYGGPDVWTVPPATGWTWDNQGTAFVNHNTYGMYLGDTSANTSLDDNKVLYRAEPAVPYTIDAIVEADSVSNQHDTTFRFGLGWRKSTDGTLTCLRITLDGINTQLACEQYRAPSAQTGSATISDTIYINERRYYRLRVVRTAARRQAFVSLTGEAWYKVYDVAYDDYHTPDQIMMMLQLGYGALASGFNVSYWNQS